MAEATEADKCASTQTHDKLVLEDGHMFDIQNMPEELYDQLYEMAANGKTQLRGVEKRALEIRSH
ncbi:hypothetical protein N0V90_005299 [Kalmusia sp. IMI 367209]|nr:hypothetical protein N0V90_005299 [Kalmusia sp. IMI 367209]